MKLSRRDFLKLVGVAAVGGVLAFALGGSRLENIVEKTEERVIICGREVWLKDNKKAVICFTPERDHLEVVLYIPSKEEMEKMEKIASKSIGPEVVLTADLRRNNKCYEIIAGVIGPEGLQFKKYYIRPTYIATNGRNMIGLDYYMGEIFICSASGCEHLDVNAIESPLIKKYYEAWQLYRQLKDKIDARKYFCSR